MASVPIKRSYHRKSVAGFVKESSRTERTGYGWFPPKHAFAAAIRSFLHDAIHFFEKLFLSFWGFWKRSGALRIFGRPPVVSGLHDDDVLLIFLRHENHVFAQIVQAAMPPGIVGLADDVILDMVGIEFVEEILGLDLVAALIDVDHDLRRQCISFSRLHPGDSRFHQI